MTEWLFVETLPSDVKGGWYAHYEHTELQRPGWQRCEIRAMLREHQDEWIEAYNQWHTEVCRRVAGRSRWWWFTEASRPHLWSHQEVVKPCVFATALVLWSQAHPECRRLYVVGCPPEVRWYLREADGRTVPFITWIAYGIRWCGTLGLMLGKLVGQMVRYARWYVMRPPPTLCGRVMFYSHLLTAKHFQEVGDHYFGQMIDTAQAATPHEVLIAYLLHDDAERRQVSQLLQASNRRVVCILDYLTWGDLSWVCAHAVWTVVSLARFSWDLPPFSVGPVTSQWFTRLFVTDQIMNRPLGTEFAVFRAMKRLLARAGISVVVYPY